MSDYVRVEVLRGRGDRPDDVVEILEAAEDVIVVGETSPGAEGIGAVDVTEEPDVVCSTSMRRGPRSRRPPAGSPSTIRRLGCSS